MRLFTIDDYDILYSYYDCKTENVTKHRINAGDKAKMQKIKQWHQFTLIVFCIPLDFEIIESSLPLYQDGLGSHLTYELTLADYSDVIKAMNPYVTYTISNISLEFDTMINASLASEIRTEYMKSSILYDRILRARIIPLNNSSTSFSVDINTKPIKESQGCCYSFLQKKEVPVNSIKILKNSLILR